MLYAAGLLRTDAERSKENCFRVHICPQIGAPSFNQDAGTINAAAQKGLEMRGLKDLFVFVFGCKTGAGFTRQSDTISAFKKKKKTGSDSVFYLILHFRHLVHDLLLLLAKLFSTLMHYQHY